MAAALGLPSNELADEIEPLRRDHDGHPGIGAVAQDGAVLRLDEELDADLAPELGDQRQPVDDEPALAVGLDDDLELAAVGEKPDAGAVALRQPDLVEEPGRFRRVVLSVFAAQLRREQRALLQDRVVAFPAEPEEKRIVQRPAIDAERQGAAGADTTTREAGPSIAGAGTPA